MALANLERLDAAGYIAVEAITYDRPPPPNDSYARPHAFVCDDGNTYWIKREAQRGLCSELVAVRVGKLVGASPGGVPVSLVDGLAPNGIDVSHLIGLGVGIEDTLGAENVRHLPRFLADGSFDPDHVDAGSRGRVIAFQTWIGVDEDTQALVQFESGRVLSIDHGSAFGSIDDLRKPSVVHLKIDSVPDDLGTDKANVRRAVKAIEQLSDDDLLAAVANVPDEAGWIASRKRRFQMFEWLSFRRDRLMEVMEEWLKA